MLSQFTIKNYKSIRDEMTLDMQAAAISEHNDQILKAGDGEYYLPISALYGPNGGGKTNVLQAIYALTAKVLGPLYATEFDKESQFKFINIDIVPFAFDKQSKEMPTEFEVYFNAVKAEYRYVLHVLNDRIVYECLEMKKYDTSRKTVVFERDNGNVAIGGVLQKIKVSTDLSDKLPLLSYLGITYRKNEIIGECIRWFEDGIHFLNYGNPVQELKLAVSSSSDIKKMILDMICEMDLDVVDFRVEKREFGDIQVYTKHNVEGIDFEINLSEESSGTRKVFSLLPFIAESLLEGKTLVIDEMDAKIHPVLLEYIITLFNDMTINKHSAQLIFTSHDLSTMNSSLFRRDEIWFVAKGNEQNSKLYSLVEFKNQDGTSVRKDAKYDKQYLEGKYGADPYLKKIIDWSVI